MKFIVKNMRIGEVEICAIEVEILDKKKETFPALNDKLIVRGRFKPMSFKILQKRTHKIAIQARKTVEKIILEMVKGEN